MRLQKEMQTKPNTQILVIVLMAIVVLFLIVWQTGVLKTITGAVADNTAFANTATCIDSDGGVYSTIQGTVTLKRWVKNYTMKDVCSGSEATGSGAYGSGGSGASPESRKASVTEYSCRNGKLNAVKIACENSCSDGACISDVDNEQCYLQIAINESATKIKEQNDCAPPAELRMTATTSDTSRYAHPASYLVDKSAVPAWKIQIAPSYFGTKLPQSIVLDMNNSYCVRGINLWVQRELRSGSFWFDIQGSRDGTTWENISSDEESVTWGASHHDTKNFQQTTVQYIKIIITRIDGKTNPTLEEIEVVGGEPEPAEYSNARFSLADVTSLYGEYGHLVRPYYPDEGAPYVLTAYDKARKKLGDYTLNSGRFIIAEDFSGDEPKGEIIELPEGLIESVIPYDSRISFFTINNSGILTRLIPSPQQISCTRTCKIEGERGVYGDSQCCEDFTPVQNLTDATSFICVKCGDETCSEHEDRYSCPQDCAAS